MIANESGCFTDMFDVIWFRSQKACESAVCTHGIITEQNGVQVFCGAVERSVAFHSDDTICNDKVGTDRGTNIDNAFVNSDPMKDILGPAITRPWDDAEHVFHTERDAGPMMRFHFRHGYDEIRSENGSREP